MLLLEVPVESFEVELHLTKMLGLELDDFQLKSDQCIECPVEEKQVEGKIPAADLDWVLAANEAEVAAELEQELLELFDQGALQVRL